MSKSFKSAAVRMKSNAAPPSRVEVPDNLWSISATGSAPNTSVRGGGLTLGQIKELVSKKRQLEQDVVSNTSESDKAYWNQRSQKMWDTKLSRSKTNWDKNTGEGMAGLVKSSYKFLGFDLGLPGDDTYKRQLAQSEADGIKKSIKLSGGSDSDANEFIQRLYIFNQTNRNSKLTPSQKQLKFWESTRDNAKSSFLKDFAGGMRTNSMTGLDVNYLEDKGFEFLKVAEDKATGKDTHPVTENEAKNFYKNKENYLNFGRAISSLSPQDMIDVGLNEKAASSIMGTVGDKIQATQQGVAPTSGSGLVTVQDVETNPMLMRAASVLNNTMIKKPEPTQTSPLYKFK